MSTTKVSKLPSCADIHALTIPDPAQRALHFLDSSNVYESTQGRRISRPHLPGKLLPAPPKPVGVSPGQTRGPSVLERRRIPLLR